MELPFSVEQFFGVFREYNEALWPAQLDALAVTGADPDHSMGEESMITFGVSSLGRLLVVAHSQRGDAIRIISARVATRHERKIYEEG